MVHHFLSVVRACTPAYQISRSACLLMPRRRKTKLKIIAILHIIVSNIRKWHISMFGRMVTCTQTSTIQVQVPSTSSLLSSHFARKFASGSRVRVRLDLDRRTPCSAASRLIAQMHAVTAAPLIYHRSAPSRRRRRRRRVWFMRKWEPLDREGKTPYHGGDVHRSGGGGWRRRPGRKWYQ